MAEDKINYEAILLKIANDNSYETWGEYMFDSHDYTQVEAAIEAMKIAIRQAIPLIKEHINEHKKSQYLKLLKGEDHIELSDKEMDEQIIKNIGVE